VTRPSSASAGLAATNVNRGKTNNSNTIHTITEDFVRIEIPPLAKTGYVPSNFGGTFNNCDTTKCRRQTFKFYDLHLKYACPVYKITCLRCELTQMWFSIVFENLALRV